MGTTFALVGGALPLGRPDARRWRGLGRLALAAAMALGFLSLLRAPISALGSEAMQAAPVVHAPGALSYHVGSSGALEVSAGSTDALRVVPAGFGRGTISPLESSTKAASGVAATYDHGALSVWYSHRGDALDQGFTVTRRPSGTANKVVIAMSTSGALHPELDSLTSLTFEGSNLPAVAYSSLKVTDATGRVLSARLGVSGTSVSIMFKDRGAVYPVRIDPWIQQALLTPPAGAEAFGSAIATSSNGTTVLVGDPYGGTGTGAATVYTSSGGSWSPGVALTPPVGSVYFGTSVALSSNGTVALVGDPSGAGGTGSATVYTLTSGVWSSGVALTAPAEAGSFGTSVALSGSGTIALVGDPYGGENGTGAATVYTYTTSWNNPPTDLVAPLLNSYEFGTSVALSNSGSIALVGDPLAGADGDGEGTGWVTSFSGTDYVDTAQIKDPAATTGGFGSSLAVSSAGTTVVVGDPTYPTGGSAGIYTASETDSAITSWAKTSTLTAPSGSQAFGTAVAITAAGTEALVGDPDPAGGQDVTGTASSYSAPSGTWSGPAAGTPFTPPPFAESFGTAVAVSGDASSAFVGDPNGSSPNPALDGTVTSYASNGRWWNIGTAANPPNNANSFGSSVSMSSAGTSILEGDESSVSGDVHGAASVYTYNGTTVGTQSPLVPPANTSSFGTSVAISGNGTTAVVGDPDSYDAATGTGGTATVYTYNGSTWSAGKALTVPSSADAPAYEFGNSVAISASGNEILVGDPGGGVNGMGAVTEFTLSGSTWSAGIALPTPATTYAFGNTVALSANGEVALVSDTGAPGGSVIPYTMSDGSFVEGNRASERRSTPRRSAPPSPSRRLATSPWSATRPEGRSARVRQPSIPTPAGPGYRTPRSSPWAQQGSSASRWPCRPAGRRLSWATRRRKRTARPPSTTSAAPGRRAFPSRSRRTPATSGRRLRSRPTEPSPRSVTLTGDSPAARSRPSHSMPRPRRPA